MANDKTVIGIYKITNPKGRVYIGQSINIEKRLSNYKKFNCKSQPKLHLSFVKYLYHNIYFIQRYKKKVYNLMHTFLS